jgi:glycosyltransferase involved in cell wall biosynthesis
MNISVIICTYSPDPFIFRRLLAAVAGLQLNDIKAELILVDNNSPAPVSEQFREELRIIPFPMKCISEPKSGLTNARLAGFEASSGDFLIFFDDDNEPEPDYLLQAIQAFSNFPNVGVFGPGHISVEFTGENIPVWIPFNKPYFQERHYESPRFACAEHWMDFYPPGTGQSMRRSVFSNYSDLVRSGALSASDRTGKSLSSAGDVQLVFEAVKKNQAAGVYPGMKLRHLISEKKTSSDYLKRLLFGMASSYPEAYAECFPHTRKVLPFFTGWQIFKKVWALFWLRVVIKKSPRSFVFQFCELLGKVYGSNHARGVNCNSLWFKLIPVLRLK